MAPPAPRTPPAAPADAHPLPAGPAAALPDAGLCVYYDGGCPLCRAEIAAYQRTEGGDTLHWVDAHAAPAAALGAGLGREAALARLHVRRGDGQLLHGAQAFVAIWEALPRWRALARLARLPGVTPLLELGYRVFLRVRPLWRPAATGVEPAPLPLLRELRTDHAGETGAVMIYRGVLALARDPALREFAQAHLRTEQRHLSDIEDAVNRRWHSRLLPLWRLSGWLTGALPACFGPRAVYATVQAVETFVDAHYATQVAMVDGWLAQPTAGPAAAPGARARLGALRALLEACRQDERAHRDDAAARWDGRRGPLLAAWCRLVGAGSAAAVRLCRHL